MPTFQIKKGTMSMPLLALKERAKPTSSFQLKEGQGLNSPPAPGWDQTHDSPVLSGRGHTYVASLALRDGKAYPSFIGPEGGQTNVSVYGSEGRQGHPPAFVIGEGGPMSSLPLQEGAKPTLSFQLQYEVKPMPPFPS